MSRINKKCQTQLNAIYKKNTLNIKNKINLSGRRIYHMNTEHKKAGSGCVEPGKIKFKTKVLPKVKRGTRKCKGQFIRMT